MNEKLNTMRRLEGRDLLPTRLACRFGLHTWERWKDATNDKGMYWKQYRTCTCCGRQEIRKAIGDSRVNY